MSPEIFLQQWQQQPLPLVAILRGITPEEAEPVAEILLDCGFRFLEVPLNSPTPYDSIRVIRKTVGDRGFVGAGTVLNVQQVEEVAKAGGQLIISPNTDAAVIGHSRYLNLISMPAVATPSEAFCALAAGASGLKLFPAESITPAVTKALRVVLPQRLVCLPVGGIQPDPLQMRAYIQAGSNGFGLGGGLYQPGISLAALRQRALAYQAAWQHCVE
ncbi:MULTISPECIES: 2-dehydro-3-deoxy-6-phosphogalactonate aldolase [Serratia]|jgi:2-dehydro-3-deoxyphosphogalactonate aldolase|uniref:2-dehydro-3-deoxy-6-phosphogalactonate aldolase n=1 Tax=Serratia liquefaciens TaxID=614 RepID=A0A515D0H3_SERLI|nr:MULTISPECIES: 2-dehydro-3-deoxy-6-phosphogalactonate aldolase [Serratia]AYO36213.1 2-dehydro-3-deoxy-6-phosphogalactonate aldolase [Serratia sp. P2ACOL2]MBI6163729.1 2-dehydro-3-deoxy-6-phosphogalactonate aldolase [Serratia liquefaciens]MBV0843128.1 2-dehydro-3-deoxy-6-phosphogalactonate aldolase [Serratia liquefaciens]MCS4319451.1 2-dehydro-3-deoxyphosphogalactonate aldolase [Serratia sp. BIGb0234]MDU5485594.1 2-dehydro-3-deoxy-6-phosphogalactonate aldolase [Serratia liquefaciens]